jgi:hypothetical protein
MNVPIRVLGIATVILWVFLIAFIALAAYSIKDLGLGAGEPQFTAAPNGQLFFSLPMYVDNRGVVDLKDLHISTVFSDAEGSEISEASTFVALIPHGQNVAVYHNITLNVNEMLNKGEQYLFNDSDLAVSLTAGLTFAELLPVEISTNITYPWGAPFSDFALGRPVFSRFDATQGRVTAPVDFENHAAFDLVGSMRVQLYDSQDSLLCESQTALNVTRGSPYAGILEFRIPMGSGTLSANQRGHFNVYFSTSLFEYGPLVIPYG